jgi:tetratricopeptide (TPR) repeat protein
MMSLFALKSPLTAHDRLERRRLILADSLSLFTLFAITAVLAVMTNYLYQSYASHQVALANRWLQRGEQAMRENKPQAAIDALSSALAFEPSNRQTEIKLAEALASAGRVQEATVYFNALLESQQGSGLINLQLARLAAQQGNESQAIDDYQRAIYGNWEGDGYVRRRDVRFELIDFLVQHRRLDQARSELLVAAGNAPEDDVSIQLEIARKMELANDPADALHTYRSVLRHHPSLREALEGAGRTAFAMGRYQEAKKFLAHALEGPALEQEPPAGVQQIRDELDQSTRLLSLYPSDRLNPKDRATRILTDRALAQARLDQCIQQQSQAPATKAAAPAAAEKRGLSLPTLPNPLQSLESRFKRQPDASTPPGAPVAPADPLQALSTRWQQSPKKITLSEVENSPDLAQSQLQLIYDTETVTQQVCGPPTGDDALLLKIAQTPNQIEEE